ncbi:MAG TPA: penicillin acylase family protein, partial [Xanthomonadales bacterium]|nr:penicillin acylase family protein [Xanthomonadales bacterium]
MALATLLRAGTLAGLFLAGVTLPGCDSGGESSIPQKTLAQATIYRDDWGVPHIVATLEESGFYALGYAQAEDQLESLLGSVYWARGQRAELQGESVLASDIEQRRWRHLQEGKEGLQRLKPQVLENYRAFVAGVHRYMDDHPAQVPAWAPDLEVSDLLTISRAVFWVGYAAVLGPAECEEPEVQLQASIKEAAGMQISGASNGWVVAPPR